MQSESPRGPQRYGGHSAAEPQPQRSATVPVAAREAGMERWKFPTPGARRARCGGGGTRVIWLAARAEPLGSMAELGREIWGKGMGRDEVGAGRAGRPWHRKFLAARDRSRVAAHEEWVERWNALTTFAMRARCGRGPPAPGVRSPRDLPAPHGASHRPARAARGWGAPSPRPPPWVNSHPRRPARD